jgi:hypothetical protein
LPLVRIGTVGCDAAFVSAVKLRSDETSMVAVIPRARLDSNANTKAAPGRTSAPASSLSSPDIIEDGRHRLFEEMHILILARLAGRIRVVERERADPDRNGEGVDDRDGRWRDR